MAKKSKTKESVTPAKTLFNFFTPGASSLKATPSKPPTKPKPKRFTAIREVIVIDDSDDDDSGPVCFEAEPTRPTSVAAGKRRRMSESSGEVEFVESPLQQNTDPKGKKKQRIETSVPKNSESNPVFGTPYLLMDSSTTPPADTSAVASTSSVPKDLGASSFSTGDASFEDVFQDIAQDEWATGDDEQQFSDVEDDEETHEDDAICPICQIQFPRREIEIHASTCLDCPSTASVSSASTATATPFRPLSTLSKPILPCKTKSNGSNAFSVLMTSSKESEAWKEASTAESSRTKGKGTRRKAPFYKVLQGMPIAVDAFRYGAIPAVTAYFLTHAHSDHYTNLSSSWKHGPIYCSQGTANLIIHMLSVDAKWVHPLPMDVPTVIPNTGGVTVTLIEANHCPGSCLFFYEGKQTVNAGDSAFVSSSIGSSRTFRYLHCGDFRACPAHTLHPAVKGKYIDHVYLDTTYLDPKYTFPPQPLVINACAELARRMISGEPLHCTGTSSVDKWMTSPIKPTTAIAKAPGRILFVVGTYSIGKERIVKAIATALNTKVYGDARKMALLRCQADPELDALLTSDANTASVHVVPLKIITPDGLASYAHKHKNTFSRVIGFRPTGWTYAQPAGSDRNPAVPAVVLRTQQRGFSHVDLKPGTGTASDIYGVPYSEHSSFGELTCFALSVNWGKMIATVNVGSENSRGKMGKWIEKWEVERKKQGKDASVAYRQTDHW